MEGSDTTPSDEEVMEAPSPVPPRPEEGAVTELGPGMGLFADMTAEGQPGSTPPVSEAIQVEEEEEVRFDEKAKLPFEGLLYLGYLTKTVHFLGHKFTIRTLSSNDVLEIGIVHKDYKDTVADQKAYQLLMVAAAVETVDSRPLPVPLTMEPSDTALRQKMDEVRKWSPFVIDQIYSESNKLEGQVIDALDAMGKV